MDCPGVGAAGFVRPAPGDMEPVPAEVSSSPFSKLDKEPTSEADVPAGAHNSQTAPKPRAAEGELEQQLRFATGFLEVA